MSVILEGVAYAWGDGHATQPLLLEKSLSLVNSIDAGPNHYVVCDVHGAVFSWGTGTDGCLGHNSEADEPVAKRIQSLQSHIITAVACGSTHSLALDSIGQVFSWGWGALGALGHNDGADQQAPRLVEFFCEQEARIDSIACGFQV